MKRIEDVKRVEHRLSQTLKIGLISTTFASLAVPMSVAAGSDTFVIEEITVTARKREINLQDAPIAVTAVSGKDFDRSNVVKLDNFNGYSPGLVVAKNDGAGRVVSIRGIGWETAQNLSSLPSVLAYVDGIYLANPLSMGLDLGELERVEVFRGPQGTEFGQGTTGGAINLVTKKPVHEEFSAYLQGGFGSYNMQKVRGMVNLPIHDTLAFRGSAQRYKRDGFAEIKGGALDGYDLDDADSITVKAALSWQPTDEFSAIAQIFYNKSDQHAAAQKNFDDPNPDPRELTQDFPGIFKLDNFSASLIAEWETPLGVTVKSLTGFQKLEKEQSADGDRLTEATFSMDRLGFGAPDNWDVLTFWDNDSEAFSQEINVSYSGESLEWVTGLYYLDHENTNDFLEATGASPFSASVEALANPSPVTLPPFASVLNFNENRTASREGKAVYAQATYNINEMFALTGGVRYQEEEVVVFGDQFFGLVNFDTRGDPLEESATTWKVGLDVHLTGDNLVYGLVSTGWKNGGVNPGAINNGALFVSEVFRPEELTAYEIGSRNTFMDRRLRFNVTAFYYDHENLHYVAEDPIPFANGVNTVPEVEEYGIETEFGYQINDSWRLDGMLSWQEGELKSDVLSLDIIDFRESLAPGLGFFTQAGFDTRVALASSTNLKGNEPPKMPDIMARLGLTNFHIFDGGNILTSRIEYVHRGEMQARVFNNPQFDTIDRYNVVNLFFDYEMSKWPVNLTLSVSNLFDKDGVNNIFNNPFGVWSTSNEYIPPREVVASVKYSW